MFLELEEAVLDDPGCTPASAPPRSSSTIDRLTAITIAIALAVAALTAGIVMKAHRDAWAQASQASENLRLALSRDIGRNFTAFDQALRGLIGALAEPGIDEASPGVRRRALFDGSINAEDVGAVMVVDAAGQVVEDSTSPIPHRLDMSQRDDFQAQRDRPDLGLVISLPYHSRLAEGDTRISITRRLPAPNGAFRGIATASLSLVFFKRLFGQLDVGPHGTITLFRDDGRVLARYPFRDQDTGRDLSQSSTFQHFAAMNTGQFVDRAAIDGVERLYTFGRIQGFPLILTVSLATGDIMGAWWARPPLIIPVLVVLLAATVMSSLLFRRELRRRVVAEARARSSAEELAWLAKTDVLTGINNRRALESELLDLWQRDRQSAMAILMVDVDRFKAFNDRLGHQAGDVALRAVATCIQGQLTMADDRVARFGGEEFVVLLPGTSCDRAAATAERIRSAVYALAIAHPGSTHGRVTVSIGMTFCSQRQDHTSAALISAADRAVYAAKQHGRNQVRAEALSRPDAGPACDRSLGTADLAPSGV